MFVNIISHLNNAVVEVYQLSVMVTDESIYTFYKTHQFTIISQILQDHRLE